MAEPLITGQSLRVAYRRRRSLFARAVDPAPVLKGVDIVIDRGETVGIVGEVRIWQEYAGPYLAGPRDAAQRHRTFRRSRRDGPG